MHLFLYFDRLPFEILNMDFYALSFILLITKTFKRDLLKNLKSQMAPSGTKGAIC